MATSKKQGKGNKPAQAPQAPQAPQPAAPVAPVAAPVATVATAPTVALRGGIAVAMVQLAGKPYRTKAAHNAGWWQTITQAAASGPVGVQALVTMQPAPVPAHFIGYCIRRGYLTPVTPQAAQATA